MQAAEPEFVILARRFAEDADADAASFDAYMAAGRLPRATEAETALRSDRLTRAALGSIEVAIVTLEHAAEAITLAKSLAERLSPRMAPDLAGGLEHLIEGLAAQLVHDRLPRRAGTGAATRPI